MIASRVLKRFLLAVGVLFVPIGSMAFAPEPAGALTFTPFTCSVGGTMVFDYGHAGNGISKNGWAGTSGASISVQYPNLGGGCSGHGLGAFVAQWVFCNKKVPGQPVSNPACQPGLRRGFNSWADVLGDLPPPPTGHRFEAETYAGAIRLSTADTRDPWQFTINGTHFRAKSTNTVLVPAGDACGPSELGFQTTARIFDPHHVSQTMTVTLCLGAITGSGLNPGDNFYNSSVDQVGIVDTAVIDSATSAVHVG